MVCDFGGEMPREVAQLRQLKGIGAYTAGAIASIAFDQRVPAVDGNVIRVASRVMGIRENVGIPSVRRELEEKVDSLVPAARPGDFNQALMDLGAAVCVLPNAELLHIPVTIFESNIFSVANNTEKNPCYLCARMRRGHLYSKAKELGCNKIALGHHFNDVIETTVMSMFYGSQLQAMPPKLHSTSFPGMTLIRPMYCIHEEDILAWKRYNELEFIQCACRFTENCTMCDNGGGGSKRQEVKTLLRRLKRDNPNIENSIFRSIHAVALDTMPGYKSEGVEHSFLERFNAMEAASDENE